MTFGKLLKNFRDKKHLSKTELANRLGVTPSYLMLVESTKRKPPSFEQCKKLSDILGLTKEERKHFFRAAVKERVKPEFWKFINELWSNRESVPNERIFEWDKDSLALSLIEREEQIEKLLSRKSQASEEILEAIKDPVAVKALLLVHKNTKEIKQTIRELLENLPKMDPEKRKAVLALCS